MSSSLTAVPVNRYERSIDDLPDEVLEYILSLVPPYKDLEECSVVCRRWHKAVKNVIRHTQKKFNRSVTEFLIECEELTPESYTPSITKRYSHSACFCGNSMYVFGGCTSTSTTFNDLWRLDLDKRQWVRPLTMGSYPSPKACATIVCYKDTLILFGGWTHPSPYPLHQGWRLFNELHIYYISCNRWRAINSTTAPPAMAGHSASVLGETMVVFGGLQKTHSLGQYVSSNDVWCFDMDDMLWSKKATTELKPHVRYGQSQLTLDDSSILILGGCGGPNMVFSDVWLLTATEPVWTWLEVQVENPQWSASHMWCHPACKIGQQVVVFSRNPVSNAPAPPYSPQWNRPSVCRVNTVQPIRRMEDGTEVPRNTENTSDKEFNVNGRRGSLTTRHASNTQPNASTSSSSGDESDPESLCQQRLTSGSQSDLSASHSTSKTVKNSEANNQQKLRLGASKKYENPENLSMGMPVCREPENLDSNMCRRIGNMVAFRDHDTSRSNVNTNRQRQLESLRRMEERLLSLSRRSNSSSSGAAKAEETSKSTDTPAFVRRRLPPSKSSMSMYVLDISNVLSHCVVRWLPVKENRGPEEMILYTLVAGKGELIMFGGIQKDATSIAASAQQSSYGSNTVSNSLYFITSPKGII
ncbi:F-box only protein 42 [Schistocerca nitens]|uniref:F-box only protein 42 n=1 Tax=Schistocerca nitens TaxID=7011 RepID=UPI002118E192|nr:F-box only protein 42 [Schistocerca nitens]